MPRLTPILLHTAEQSALLRTIGQDLLIIGALVALGIGLGLASSSALLLMLPAAFAPGLVVLVSGATVRPWSTHVGWLHPSGRLVLDGPGGQAAWEPGEYTLAHPHTDGTRTLALLGRPGQHAVLQLTGAQPLVSSATSATAKNAVALVSNKGGARGAAVVMAVVSAGLCLWWLAYAALGAWSLIGWLSILFLPLHAIVILAAIIAALATGVDFDLLRAGPQGLEWRTQRVAWEKINSVHAQGGCLTMAYRNELDEDEGVDFRLFAGPVPTALYQAMVIAAIEEHRPPVVRAPVAEPDRGPYRTGRVKA